MPDQLPEIELEDRGSKARYVLRGPGGAEAEMTFTKIGEHQIIIDYVVYPKRPSDADLLIPALEVHEQTLGRVPRVVAGTPRSTR